VTKLTGGRVLGVRVTRAVRPAPHSATVFFAIKPPSSRSCFFWIANRLAILPLRTSAVAHDPCDVETLTVRECEVLAWLAPDRPRDCYVVVTKEVDRLLLDVTAT